MLGSQDRQSHPHTHPSWVAPSRGQPAAWGAGSCSHLAGFLGCQDGSLRPGCPLPSPTGPRAPPPALLGAYPVAGPAQSCGLHPLGVTVGPQGKAGAPTSGAGLLSSAGTKRSCRCPGQPDMARSESQERFQNQETLLALAEQASAQNCPLASGSLRRGAPRPADGDPGRPTCWSAPSPHTGDGGGSSPHHPLPGWILPEAICPGHPDAECHGYGRRGTCGSRVGAGCSPPCPARPLPETDLLQALHASRGSPQPWLPAGQSGLSLPRPSFRPLGVWKRGLARGAQPHPGPHWRAALKCQEAAGLRCPHTRPALDFWPDHARLTSHGSPARALSLPTPGEPAAVFPSMALDIGLA